MKIIPENNTIFLGGSHEGWIITLLTNGIEIISPAIGNLIIEETSANSVNIIEDIKEDKL